MGNCSLAAILEFKMGNNVIDNVMLYYWNNGDILVDLGIWIGCYMVIDNLIIDNKSSSDTAEIVLSVGGHFVIQDGY